MRFSCAALQKIYEVKVKALLIGHEAKFADVYFVHIRSPPAKDSDVLFLVRPCFLRNHNVYDIDAVKYFML